METKLKRSAADVQDFRSFVFSLQTTIECLKEEEIILSDPPAEFLDPLTYILMRNPVKMPSGMVMEKTIISQHLLTNPMDPFTRVPMTEADLIPDTELKNKINEWINARRKEYRMKNQ